MNYKCLSIGEFDGLGRAGIQADLKTFSALECYGMNVLTALPVQNTKGVNVVYEIPALCVEQQLEAIFKDIVPSAVKIGMLHNAVVIKRIVKFFSVNNYQMPIIIDPVMVAKSKEPLLARDAIEVLKKELIPLATIVTPNINEAELLSGTAEMTEAAMLIKELGAKAVLVKGGNCKGDESNDFYYDGETSEWLYSPRIRSKNTHGIGCTLSAAICSYVARGYRHLDACKAAKNYIYNVINDSKDFAIGKGHGPLNHFYGRRSII